MKKKLLISSVFMITMLYGMLLLFLLLVFNYLDWSLSFLVLFSILISIINFLVAPKIMDFIVEKFYNTEFNFQLPDYLNDFIKELCINENIVFPKIGLINDGSPNAFTYGKTKNDARIVLSQGIFDLLSEGEVKAVVAHEIGHIVHYDMLIMTIVQIIPLILYYIYNVCFESVKNKHKDKDSKDFSFVGIIAYFFYLVSECAILWFSRVREYYADEFAVHITGNPNALANALVKIGYGLTSSRNSKNINNANSDNIEKGNNKVLYNIRGFSIFDDRLSKGFAIGSYDNGSISKDRIKLAANWEFSNPWAKWHEIFSTHPLISKRIIAISKFSNIYNQDTFIEFDNKKNAYSILYFISDILFMLFPVLVIIFFVIFGIIFEEHIGLSYIGYAFFALAFAFLVLIMKKYNHRNFEHKRIIDLLEDMTVSNITSVPCIIEGEIIGRGNAGFIFSEDFVIKDDTGIMFLDYQQPTAIQNTFFALFKSKKIINNRVIVKGWYRRNIKPYIEVYSIKIKDDIVKSSMYKVLMWLLLVLVFTGFFLIFLDKAQYHFIII